MKKKIQIRSLRNINSLDFEMPEPGVWLLTGENGTGKTTLLACLLRIGERLAFPNYFQTSAKSDRLDNFSKASISYSIGDETVTYKYAGVRWVPTPRRNARVLSSFGYASVIFLGATADRITPKPEDFSPNRVHAVSKAIKEAANKIFDTEKFESLRRVNVNTGQSEAYVFLSGNSYYSEKNFSLGELCVLKLIERIIDAPPGSLIIVDELEMALHPSAQIRLYNYLVDAAKRGGHTVIFSTHSVSLIKSAGRKSILFLTRKSTGIEIEREPYLSVILGGLAHVEEKSADAVVYVEDEMAEYAARALIKLVSADRLKKFAKSNPRVEVVPIGGFPQVIAFLKRHEALHRPSVKSFALLDADVKSETVLDWQKKGDHAKLAWLAEYSDRVSYLPWTPEVGIYEAYRSNSADFLSLLRAYFENNQIQLNLAAELPANNSDRAQCKKWVRQNVEFLGQQFGVGVDDARKAFCELIARRYFESNRSLAMQLISPLIS